MKLIPFLVSDDCDPNASLHIVIHHKDPLPPHQHRMSRPLPTEQHSSTRGSVQRFSHRRVAVHACGICVAWRSCPPRPRPGNADFSFHDPRAVEREPGSWEGAAISFFQGVWQLPASDTAPLLAAWFCRACGDFVPFTSLLSSSSRRFPPICGRVQRVKAALPSRSLGGRESCSPQGSRIGNALCCCSIY